MKREFKGEGTLEWCEDSYIFKMGAAEQQRVPSIPLVGVVADIVEDEATLYLSNRRGCWDGQHKYWTYKAPLDLARHIADNDATFRLYWPPQFRTGAECAECFGTGFKGGFQAPCSRGCS